MKQVIFFALFALLGVGLFAFLPHKKSKILPANKGFALVELFTSEGCSSCPPADALVAQLQKESSTKPIYVLAYHVDYWDHQGWKDAFSSPAFSQRQKDYSNWLGSQEIYTPQVVVNGQRQLVGSDERALRGAVGEALEDKVAAGVRLSAVFGVAGSAAVAGSAPGPVAGAAGSVAVSYRVDGGSASDQLLVAVVEKSAVRKIGGGENGGRTLLHVQIVRELQKVALSASSSTAFSGVVSVAVPAGFDTGNWEIVGFLQNGKTGAVEGASRAVFAAKSGSAN